ncbi:Tautomerase/MIF superfamily [Aspergillus venezuelensis]
MPQKRHRIDFSLLRRRQRFSSASSSSLSPTVPVLESPLTFHALAAQEISEATLKQNRFNRLPGKPSMTFENQEDDDDGSIPNLTSGDLKDGRSPRTAHKSSAEERPLTQPKSQFYEESFSSRSPWLTTGTRVGQDSFVVIEIKTNINVKDEDSVTSKVTTRMAQIYQRSESFMIVTIQQIASLRFGNLALPAYSMKIYALPYLIAPITNLRSTILIQAALQDILHIPPSRGIILYIPVPEENMATNNTTMMGEIARLEHDTRGREPGIFKTLSRSLSRRKKSSSAVSAPLSVATTSSWAAGSEGLDQKPATISESEEMNNSVNEGDSRPGKSRTLRLFVSRRTQEHSGQSGAEE